MRRRSGWRRATWLVAMAVIVAFLACDTSIELIEVEESASMPIPTTGKGIEFDKEEFEVGEGLDPMESPEMEQYGGTAAAVAEVYLTDASLTVTDGAENLDFLDFIALYIEAPGMDRVLLAQEDSVPVGKTHFGLDVHDDVDLGDYVSAGLVQPIVVVSGIEPDLDPGSITTMRLDFTMSMGVSMAGTCEALLSGD